MTGWHNLLELFLNPLAGGRNLIAIMVYVTVIGLVGLTCYEMGLKR